MTAAERRQIVIDGIAAAARLARREPGEVQLIAVSKGRSAEEIEMLIAAGQRDFGENRVQEALAKWPPLLKRYPEVRLHEIGQLQSNKAADALRIFSTIHSVDRASLVDALAKAGPDGGTAPDVYVQVNVGDEPQKGGCSDAEVGELVDRVRGAGLNLRGLMAIPPLGNDPSPYFALLAKLAQRHGLTGLSMGMSSDYRQAVMLGATAVRIGSALFDH
jgi:PLP dependent protein